jgi:surface antigen
MKPNHSPTPDPTPHKQEEANLADAATGACTRSPRSASRRAPSLGAVACAAVLALTLSGCETSPSQQQSGTIVGGVLGGVLGSQVGGGSGRTAATVIGALIGASIGGNVGRSMDQTDRLKTAQALESTRTGASSAWRNPDTGASYKVTPTRTRPSAEGPCREYTVEATVGGRPETVYGQACRQKDGSWQVMQ